MVRWSWWNRWYFFLSGGAVLDFLVCWLLTTLSLWLYDMVGFFGGLPLGLLEVGTTGTMSTIGSGGEELGSSGKVTCSLLSWLLVMVVSPMFSKNSSSI